MSLLKIQTPCCALAHKHCKTCLVPSAQRRQYCTLCYTRLLLTVLLYDGKLLLLWQLSVKAAPAVKIGIAQSLRRLLACTALFLRGWR